MKIRRRSAWTHSLAGLASCALAAGCHSSNNNPAVPPDGGSPDGGAPDGGSPDGGALGSGALTTSTAVANGASFALPFDAAPSPDGTSVYFTGVQATGASTGPAILKSAATAGSTPSALAVGGDIGAPLGVAVSTNGTTVYAADPAYNTATDKGAIFKVASAGGAPAPLAETVDYSPRAIAVASVGGSDNLYFIGDDKTDGASGIFKDAGGTVTAVLKGAPANNPQAVTAYADGTVYFVDGSGSVQKIAAGGTTATSLGTAAKNLNVSFPAGIAVSNDGKFVLVPDTDPMTGKQSIARIDVTSGAVTQLALTLGANAEAGGLHRAANADIYSFVDTGAGATGTVYLLK